MTTGSPDGRQELPAVQDHAWREALLDRPVRRNLVGATRLYVEPPGEIIQEQTGLTGDGAAPEGVAQALGHGHDVTDRIGGAQIGCMPRISGNSRYQWTAVTPALSRAVGGLSRGDEGAALGGVLRR